jgi:hypothetical protein
MSLPHIERVMLGITAASGLVVAGCLSGLLSAMCTAMVETYTKVISSFGAGGLAAMIAFLGMTAARTPPSKAIRYS